MPQIIFPLLSVIPLMAKIGSNFIITNPYLGGQLLTERLIIHGSTDPGAQQCRKSFSVIPPMPKFPVAPTTSDPAAYAAYKRDYEEYSSWYEKV
jgi:hypothetical protein